MSRIVVTGLGIVSAAGRGVEATERALRESRSGLGRLTRFVSPRCGHLPVGEVHDFEAHAEVGTVALGRIALTEALQSARLLPVAAAMRERVAFVNGNCVGGMLESQVAVAELLETGECDNTVFTRHDCGYTTATLARDFDLRGPSITVSTACSSGAQAIATGSELLAAHAADIVVAGGVDVLCGLTLNGFASLLVVDPEGCRPFDSSRRGMSLGEGAAYVVLERESDARRRGVAVHATLAGFGNTCDAFHPTAPDPKGTGAERVMRDALEQAHLTPDDVDYVNAHGTGTRENDKSEGQALCRLFGSTPPAISSTKRIFGHALAAAGAIESVVCILAIEHSFVPGNSGFSQPDAECGIVPLRETANREVRAVVSNSFGFGGNNTSLCFTKFS